METCFLCSVYLIGGCNRTRGPQSRGAFIKGGGVADPSEYNAVGFAGELTHAQSSVKAMPEPSQCSWRRQLAGQHRRLLRGRARDH